MTTTNQPTKYGFINNLLNTGQLGTVHVGVDTKTVVKLAAALVATGALIILMTYGAKKLFT